MTADMAKVIEETGARRVERWSVVALQLDLLDNKPTVVLRSNLGAETVVSPHQIVTEEIETTTRGIFGAGYLSGYSDCQHGKALGAALIAAGLGALLEPSS